MLISSVHKSTKGIFFFLSVHEIYLKHPPSPHFVESSCAVSVRSKLFYVDCSWIGLLKTILPKVSAAETSPVTISQQTVKLRLQLYSMVPNLSCNTKKIAACFAKCNQTFKAVSYLPQTSKTANTRISGDGRDVTCKLPLFQTQMFDLFRHSLLRLHF